MSYRVLLVLAAAGCGASSAGGSDSNPAEPAAAPEASGAAEPGEAESPEDLVRFHLVADVTRVSPGQELSLGARFDIEPTWHIYWMNPGETGLATQVEITAPEGFEVGATRYPGPEPFESPGGITSYGYEDFILLSAPVAAPDPLPEGSHRFEATASWLACREVCIQGRGKASLTLPPATPDAPSRSSHAGIFSEHRTALPRPLAELDGASHEVKRRDGRITVKIEVPGAERLEYFPSREEQVAFTGQAGVPGEKKASIHISYRAAGASSPERTGGVLAVLSGEEKHYYRVDLPWSKE